MKNEKLIWRFPQPIPNFVNWSRMKKLRQTRGLTIAEICLAAGGISPQTYLYHEKGFIGKEETRKRIAEALGVPESELYPVMVEGDRVVETGEILQVEITE